MKRTVFACLLVMLYVGMPPAVTVARGNAPTGDSANSNGNSANAAACRANWRTWGFKNNGACVSFFARGGTIVAADPKLELGDGVFSCSVSNGCFVAVHGQGLQPGSLVIVGDPSVQYGVSFVVRPDGTVSVEGIFQVGSCTTRPSADFIARGVSADGSPIESEVLTVDLTQVMPRCT